MVSGRAIVPLLSAVAIVLAIAGGLWLTGTFDASSGSPELPPRASLPSPGPSRPAPEVGPAPAAPIATQAFTEQRAADPSAASLPGPSGGFDLRGVIQDPEGQPLADAEVLLIQDVGPIRAQPRDGEILARVRTPAEGTFIIGNLQLGETYVLQAGHAGFTTERRHPIDAADAASLDQSIRLGRGIAVEGRVSDDRGLPLDGVEITAYEMTVVSDGAPVPERLTRSRADGTYVVTALNPGLKRLTARKAGYSTDGRDSVDLRKGEGATGVDFRLTAGLTITGQVVDRGSRQPIKGVMVRAQPVSPLEPPPGGEVADLPEDRAAPVPAAQVPAEEAAPKAGGRANPAVVHVMHRLFVAEAAASDENGRFVLSGLMPAHYQLSLRARGWQPVPSVPADAGAENVVIPMAMSPRVSGMVVDDETGQPVRQFSVALVQAPDFQTVSAGARQRFENDQGVFEYLDARPGTHRLLAEAPAYAGGRSDLFQLAPEQQISRIVVRLVRGATLTGVVRTSGGQPLAAVHVSLAADRSSAQRTPFDFLMAVQGGAPRTKVTMTDAQGRWALANVLGGTYRVHAEHPEFCSGESEAVPCPDRGSVRVADIALLRGAVVRGMVKTKDGRPDGRATVVVSATDPAAMFSRSVTTGADGRFDVRGLKPGTYSIVVAMRDGQVDIFEVMKSRQDPSRTFTVQDGETKEMEF